MKNKFKYLTKVSLERKIKTKWFFVANVILAVVIVGLTNIDNIIKFFGGDFSDIQNVHVIDKTNKSYELFDSQLKSVTNIFDDSSNERAAYKLIKVEDVETDYKKIVEEKPKDLVVIFNMLDNGNIGAILVSEKHIDTLKLQTITNALNNTKVAVAMEDSNISAEELSKIYSPIELKREFLDETKTDSGEKSNMIMSTVFPVFILPFFMLTVFLVQMIGAEVNDEKTTRGMEIIISNVSPKTHLFSKVVAGNLFVIIQGGLLLLFGIVGILIRGLVTGGNVIGSFGIDIKEMLATVLTPDIVNKLVYIIPITIILMMLTFVAYSLLAGILSSMTTNIEDFQQLQTPIMIILLVGYYLSMMAGLFEGSIFIKIIAFIPLISAILSPSMLLLGQLTVLEVLISIGVMVVFNFGLIKYGLRVYKVGILNYSSNGLWKKMFKALKE